MRLLIWVRCVDNLERFFVVSCLFAISTTKWSISVVTSSCCSSCLTAQGYNHASDALWPQEWLNLGKSAVRLGQREINSMRKGNLFRLPTAARVQKGEFAKDFHKLIKKKNFHVYSASDLFLTKEFMDKFRSQSTARRMRTRPISYHTLLLMYLKQPFIPLCLWLPVICPKILPAHCEITLPVKLDVVRWPQSVAGPFWKDSSSLCLGQHVGL